MSGSNLLVLVFGGASVAGVFSSGDLVCSPSVFVSVFPCLPSLR